MVIFCLTVRSALANQALAGFAPFPAHSTPTMVVVRVYFADETMRDELAAVLDVWEVNYGASSEQQYLVVMISAAQADALRTAGLRVEVDGAKTATLDQQWRLLAPQQGGIPGYACYRTVEETYADLAALATQRPDLATWTDVGDSWNRSHAGDGPGYDLHVLVLTNRAIAGPKPRFFLMAAIHARELTTAETATRFAEQLVAGYGQDADATWVLDHHEIHILAVANPDGRKWAEQLIYWRKNTNRADGCTDVSPFFSYYGVDLNRNSGFKWGQCEGSSCSTTLACRDTFRGSGPASEPETQAVQDYLRSIFADQRGPGDFDAAPVDASGLMVTLHSYSQLVLFPWGWRATPSPNHTQLQTLGRKLGYYTNYRVCQSGGAGCLYMTDGTTDDWAYGELGIAAYTIEMGTAFFEDCGYFEQQVFPETAAALRYAAKTPRRPYQSPAGPESIDLAVTPARILSGAPITLTAMADDTRLGGSGEAVESIAAARYSLSAPSWVTGTQVFEMTPLDGAFDTPVENAQATIDTSGWPVGRQLLLVESQDQAGNWGVPSGVFVEVLASPHGLSASAAPPSYTAGAGAVVTVTVAITNTGLVSDSYSLVTASPWPVTMAGPVGPLGPLQQATVMLQISVPQNTPTPSQQTVTLTFASLSDGTIQAQAPVDIHVVDPTATPVEPEPGANRLLLPWIGR
jgi:carboxypeptidase T